MVVAEEEPVAAPRDVAVQYAVAGHRHRHLARVAPRRDVGQRHPTVGVQLGAHRADRRVDRVHAGAQPSQMCEGGDDADRAVAAHAEVADVVEEDHAAGAAGVLGWREQRAHEHVIAARLVDERTAPRVAFGAKARPPLGHRAASEVGAAADHQARRLAAGVRIDEAGRNGCGRRHHVLRALELNAAGCGSGGPSRRTAPMCAKCTLRGTHPHSCPTLKGPHP